jgi:4-hydroxy-tetrahydrodipicolinate synthase
MKKPDKINFAGMLPILPTVINNDGSIDLKSERQLVEYCLSNDAKAIGHLAWASEFSKLSDEDRKIITQELVASVAGRTPVFIGVTAASARISQQYVMQAESLGANIVMAALPYANVPSKQEAYDFYRRLSESSSLPIIIQDVTLPRQILDSELLVKLYTEFENIHYIKAEDSDFLAKTAAVIEACHDTDAVIGGYGGKHMIHMLRLGVRSFMTGTEALDIHGHVVASYLAGRKEEAAKYYYEKLLPYFVFYERYGEELLKKMLHWRGIIDSDAAIEPHQKPAMTELEVIEFKWILERIGFLKNLFNAPAALSTKK